jgi:hypothetical protein
LELVDTKSANIDGSAKLTGYTVAPNTAVVINAIAGGAVTTAKFKVYLTKGDSTTAPTVAGTYGIKITPATVSGSGPINSTAQTLTLTVAADANLDTVASPTNSTSYLNSGETVTATADATVAAARTLSANAAATIVLTQKNAANKGVADDARAVGESLTVTMTGPGSVAIVANGSDPADAALTGARALTLKNGDYVAVFADGSAGTTVVTLANSAGTVIATETLTFYSTVTKTLTATALKAYVAAGATTAATFYVTAADADGRPMANGAGTITVKPTDATSTLASAGTCTYYAAKALTATNAAGYYCSAVGAATTKFGAAEYTFTATNADATTVTAKASTTFADTIATKITVTGPASAAAGEKIKLTYTATEKNGYPVADLTYEGAATSGRTIWDATTVPEYSSSSFAPFNTGETITTVSGVATKELFVPVTVGNVTATWTLSGDGTAASGAVAKAISGTEVTYSVAIVNPGVDAAAAAAEEATAAANDATDAALSAAEAAEAATAMAQEAVDAVAELSASVTKLISALRAQITTLTNLVVKIQKKVKA